MRANPALVVFISGLLVISLIGCQPASSPSASAPAPGDGPEALVAALRAAGANARLGARFAGDPLPAQGVVMCVGTEVVQLYVFRSVRERIDAAAKIDPKDPSNIGTAVVEWTGRPRFWQRDRLLVLYLGEDVATEASLRATLGAPFTSGQGGRALLRDDSCAQPRSS